LLLIIALLGDLRTAMRGRQAERERLAALNRPEALRLGVSDRRYEDPQGRFALTLPEPWLRLDGKQAEPYAVIFQGPKDIEIRVLVTDLPHDRFDLLLAQIRGRELELDLQMNIRTVDFLGRPAVERYSRLPRSGVYALDFLVGHTAHHVLVSIPLPDFDGLLPVAKEILQTYEAPAGRRWTPPPDSGEEAPPTEDGKTKAISPSP
jgi:hypothetical protein